MPLSTVLLGFRVPNEILVRFLRANGVRSFDCDIEYGSRSESSEAAAWPATEFLRSKLADAGGDPKTKLLIFVPHVPSGNPPLHVYVTYAYVMAHAQRKFGLAELPDRAPRGLAELRSEILACAGPGGEHLLGAPGMQGEEGEDVTGSLFLVFSDEAHFPAELPLIPASQLRCNHCEAVLRTFQDRRIHRYQVHGIKDTAEEIRNPPFPDY